MLPVTTQCRLRLPCPPHFPSCLPCLQGWPKSTRHRAGVRSLLHDEARPGDHGGRVGVRADERLGLNFRLEKGTELHGEVDDPLLRLLLRLLYRRKLLAGMKTKTIKIV